MKKPSLWGLLLAGILAATSAFGEGEIGTQAYPWTGLSNLAPSPTTYSLADYSGKVVLQVVFQYNCGGCTANAGRIGRLVDTLDRGPDSAKFQAVGTEIATATYANIQSYRNTLTNSNTLTLDFPLVKVPHDTAIAAADATGEKWKRYNSYRDTYFVIGHDGLIKAKISGNTQNAMSTTLYQNLRTALNTALANVPASIAGGSNPSAGFRADRVGRGYRFQRASSFGTAKLRILDMQGRVMRSFDLTAGASEVVWNGLDASGSPVPYGLYFARAEGDGLSFSRRLPLLP